MHHLENQCIQFYSILIKVFVNLNLEGLCLKFLKIKKNGLKLHLKLRICKNIANLMEGLLHIFEIFNNI